MLFVISNYQICDAAKNAQAIICLPYHLRVVHAINAVKKFITLTVESRPSFRRNRGLYSVILI